MPFVLEKNVGKALISVEGLMKGNHRTKVGTTEMCRSGGVGGASASTKVLICQKFGKIP